MFAQAEGGYAVGRCQHELLQRIRPHITYSHTLVPAGSVVVSTAHRQASDYNVWV